MIGRPIIGQCLIGASVTDLSASSYFLLQTPLQSNER